MKTVRTIFDFWGLTCALLCAAGGFYFISNNYFAVDGKMTDFSLYGWVAMIVLWAVGLWRYCRNKPFLLWFAMAVSVVVVSFDCYRMVMYASSGKHLLYIRILLGVETVLLLGLLILKKCGSVGRGSIGLTVAVLLLTNFGALFMYPQICPLAYIYIVAGGYAVLWGIFHGVSAKKANWVALAGVGSLLLLVCGLGALFYLRLPGIRFYEPKITEPTKDVKVSIVIPVYNAEDTIERCLDSLRRQTLKEIEIIAVDDGSTDKTPEILAEYAAHDARIKVIRQENAYVGAARNNGLKYAKGEYVGFVDSDDWVSEDFYEQLYQTAIYSGRDVVMVPEVLVVRQLSPVYEAEVLQKEKISVPELSKPLRQHQGKLIGYVWNKIYKRDFLTAHNISFTTRWTIYEDGYFYVLLLLYLDNIGISDKGTYYYSKGERVTVSTVDEHISPKDEAMAMFADLERLIENAPVGDDVKENVRQYAEKMRYKDLQNFYNLLKEERAAFVMRCIEQFGEENCHFSKKKW